MAPSIVIFTLVGILIAAGIASIAVMVTRVTKDKVDVSYFFQVRTLLRAYLHLISMVTLIVGIIGGAILVKALLSYSFGFQFSYPIQSYYYTDAYIEEEKEESDDWKEGLDKIELNGEDYYVDLEERKVDIVNGATLLSTMFVLFAIHKYFKWQMEKGTFTLMRKLFAFSSLGLYSLLSIVLLPIAIYSTINYAVFFEKYLQNQGDMFPGEMISTVVFVLPMWIYYLWYILKNREK